jgi:hypothetical protein
VASDRALGKARKRVTGALDAGRRFSNRILIASKDWEEQRQATAVATPTVQERQRELIDFYERYEDLVETLCQAAQLGPTPKLESRYQASRARISADYPSLRKFVVAFLQYSIEDAEQGIALWGRSADAFEALVAAPDIDAFLRADDGSMISRINRTRCALNQYGEHLRQLAAAEPQTRSRKRRVSG